MGYGYGLGLGRGHGMGMGEVRGVIAMAVTEERWRGDQEQEKSKRTGHTSEPMVDVNEGDNREWWGFEKGKMQRRKLVQRIKWGGEDRRETDCLRETASRVCWVITTLQYGQ